MGHVKTFTTSKSPRVLEMHNLGSLLEFTKSHAIHHVPIAQTLQAKFRELDDQLLNNVLLSAKSTPTPDRFELCHTASIRAGESIARNLVSLYLAVEALSGTNASRQTQATIVMRFLDYLQCNGQTMTCQCGTGHLSMRRPVTLVEQKCSDAAVQGPSWRDRIRQLSHQQSESHEKELIAFVGAICGDLEHRCANVEQPLRDAQRRAEALQSELATLQARNGDLEQEILDVNDHLSLEIVEKRDIRESLETENERLIGRVRALEQILKDSTELAGTQLERLQAETRARELHLRTSLTEKEMYLDEVVAERDRLGRLHTEAASAMQEANATIAEHTSELGSIRDELNIKLKEIQILQHANSDLTSNVIKITRVKADVEEKLDALTAELGDCNKHNQEMAASHAITTKSLTDGFEKKLGQMANEVEKLQEDILSERRISEQQLESAQRSVEDEVTVKEQLMLTIANLRQTLSGQEMEIASLEKVVATRDEEIAEFQAMRQTLATAIGQLPERKHSRKSVHYAPYVELSPQNRQQSRWVTAKQQETSQKAPRPSTEVGSPDVASSYGSTSAEDGSTPKRAKPHKPFKLPAIRQPGLSTMATPKSVRARSQRPALGDVSATLGNRSPSKGLMRSTRKRASSEKEDAIMEQDKCNAELDELDFGSEVFTSTPFTPARAATCRNEEDDETVDD